MSDLIARPMRQALGEVLEPPALPSPAPLGSAPVVVRNWFDDAAAAIVPEYDATLLAARGAADAYARRAKADNTRRAYRAGVRAWCAWCTTHALPCLPARSADVVAFLAAERGRGMSLSVQPPLGGPWQMLVHHGNGRLI